MEARSVWNPEPAKNPPWRWSAGNPQGLVVHWVGGGAMRLDQQPHDACHAAVRSIQRYEMHSAPDNYSDIAYNTLACPHGILIEGRGLGVQGAANGGGTNGTYASVCVLGGQGDIFTAGHRQAIEEAWKYFPGRLHAHRDVNSTGCPGDEIAGWVHARGAGPGANTHPLPPAPSPSPSPGGGLVGLYVAMHGVGTRIGSGRTLRVTTPYTKGTDVADVQSFLIVVCGQSIAKDGVYGPATAAAVTNYQRFFHLAADGIFGPASRAAAAKILLTRFP